MKRLTLLRHAKSSWDEPGQRDFDRPLNERGRGAGRRMGEELKRRHIRFDLVLASPAERVRETMREVEAGFGKPFEPRFDEGIYMASSRTLLDIVRSLPEVSEQPLIVGHNPGLEGLIAALTNAGPRKFPTGAMAIIDLPVEKWSEVEDGTGDLAELILPRELD